MLYYRALPSPHSRGYFQVWGRAPPAICHNSFWTLPGQPSLLSTLSPLHKKAWPPLRLTFHESKCQILECLIYQEVGVNCFPPQLKPRLAIFAWRAGKTHSHQLRWFPLENSGAVSALLLLYCRTHQTSEHHNNNNKPRK